MNKGRKILLVIAVAVGVGVSAVFLIDAPGAEPEGSGAEHGTRTVSWRHVHGLGVDPADRGILYIATHGDFYQSANGGPPVKVDEQRADYMAFNAPPDEGMPLYASGHPATGGNTGLIKSTDGGRTWHKVADVLEPPVDFHAMSVGKSVIIGYDSSGRGLFKSVDAGGNWEALPTPDYITALAVSPADQDAIFAGFAGNQRGVAKSADGGMSWTMLEDRKGDGVFALFFDNKGILYASSETGLARSADMGLTWEEMAGPELTVTSIAADSENGVIYVAGYSPDGFQEVYRSLDDGKTWDLVGTNKEL